MTESCAIDESARTPNRSLSRLAFGTSSHLSFSLFFSPSFLIGKKGCEEKLLATAETTSISTYSYAFTNLYLLFSPSMTSSTIYLGPNFMSNSVADLCPITLYMSRRICCLANCKENEFDGGLASFALPTFFSEIGGSCV